MCGIAVVVGGRRDEVIDAAKRMTAAQRHRGPDDEGLEVFDLPDGRTLAMGFRRLAIHDLSAAGHQPMTDPRTGITIVFNGEIYNFRDLRRELEAQGHAFRSASDTEVLLAGFTAWGHDVFTRLAGMYAAVVYEPKLNWLTVVRDPLGIKPIYVARTADGLAVASEVKALRASGVVPTTVDRAAVASFLAYGAVQRPLTILKAAKAQRPATYTLFDLNAPGLAERTTRFWAFPNPREGKHDGVEFRRAVGDKLRTAVEDHLDSDVPVGIFLSRGIDSTAILKLACEARPGRIDAFTVSVGAGTQLDEAPVAERTAKLYGARFHRIQVSNEQAQQDFDDWFDAMDQPTIDGLNTFIVSRAVKRAGITVALSGLGGDELFAGYSTFQSAPMSALASQLTRVLPNRWRREIPRGVAKLLRGRPREVKAVESVLKPEGDVLRATLARRRLFSDAHLHELGFSDHAECGLEPEWVLPHDDALRPLLVGGPSAVRQAEMLGYMGNMLLRDSDVYSMATSLELRVPMLDQRVVAFALNHSLPSFASQPSKAAILGAACGGLPAEVLDAPKQGFALDYERFVHARADEMKPSVARFLNGSPTVPNVGTFERMDLDPHRRVALWLASRALGA
jgi:asparagine synthase (glutamine-hydrolysing)